MVGQFPDGIDFHVRNLQWALLKEDHIFIITLPSIIEKFKLINSDQVTYIPFKSPSAENGFFNFWSEFPFLVKKHNINPQWFLFMEEDILFFMPKVKTDENLKKIKAFLGRGNYRNILLNDEFYHSRVWEGAQLVNGKIVQNAIENKINFSFTKETFLDRERERYEIELGGKITMSKYQTPDTMDEFGLYCALKEKTIIEHDVRAIHLRGPESVHRLFPEIYRYGNELQLETIQNKLPYIDVLLVVAVYYIVGLWDEVNHLDWSKLKPESKQELNRLLTRGNEWMTFHEYTRLDSLMLIIKGKT